MHGFRLVSTANMAPSMGGRQVRRRVGPAAGRYLSDRNLLAVVPGKRSVRCGRLKALQHSHLCPAPMARPLYLLFSSLELVVRGFSTNRERRTEAVKRVIPVLLSALVFASLQPAWSQEDAGERRVERALAAVAAADTVTALAELREALELNPELADAYYHIGRLYTQRASAVETDFEDRKKAEDALTKALQLKPNHPPYLLELAKLRLKQHMRVDAARLLRRARERAEKLGNPEILADLHYSLGYIKELRYQALRHKRMRPFFRGPPVARFDLLVEDRPSRYTNDYLDRSADIEGSGELVKEEMIEHYRAAVRADPSHIAASIRLMGQLLDEYRLSEYLAVARQLVELHPDRPEPRLYRGLGLHVAGREAEAEAEFEEALARMEPGEREAVENLSPVLRRRDAADYRSLAVDEREEFNRRYWQLNDPLLLTSSNERRLEHLARVAYSDLRFSAPATGQRGWETDQGIIYIRYGHPEEIASFSASSRDYGNPFAVGQRSIIWTYGEDGPVFVFRQNPGYLKARFAGDYEFIAQNYRHVQPAAYTNIPSIPVLMPLPVQIARFRGRAADEVAVELHAALPLVDLAEGVDLVKGEIEVGMFLLNARGQEIVRRTDTEVITYAESENVNEHRSWRIALPPSSPLVAAVEARDAVTWRAATARDTFTAVPFLEDSLAISDLLIADLIIPLVEEPERREDLEVLPNAALRYGSGDPVHLYYEVYGLQPDEEGFVAFDVSLQLRVKELHRGGGVEALLGALADAWGFTIKGDDRLELQYNRQLDLDDRDRVIEYLSLDPQEVPAGAYEIRIRVWDRVAERMADQQRTFTVVVDE